MIEWEKKINWDFVVATSSKNQQFEYDSMGIASLKNRNLRCKWGRSNVGCCQTVEGKETIKIAIVLTVHQYPPNFGTIISAWTSFAHEYSASPGKKKQQLTSTLATTRTSCSKSSFGVVDQPPKKSEPGPTDFRIIFIKGFHLCGRMLNHAHC